MTSLPAQILALHDAGSHPDAIASRLAISTGYVYGILRRERPDRTRKPRERNSVLRLRILGLRECGIAPGRVVALLEKECSKAYVYRVLKERETGT